MTRARDLADVAADATGLATDAELSSGLASKLDAAAGQVINFWTVTKTDTFTATVAPGSSTPVTGLSIPGVALSSASNKLLIMAFFGTAASSGQRNQIGLAVSDGSSLLSIGTSPSNRTAVTAGGFTLSSAASTNSNTTKMHISIVHAPGDTSSYTYSAHAINIDTSTRTLYVNRNESDADNASIPRGVSALHIMEISA
jgi:hypothetical protein